MSDVFPSDLIWRPQPKLATPVSQWFRGEMGDQLKYQLERSESHQLGVLDRSAVCDLLGLRRSGPAERPSSSKILNLSVWFDHWIMGLS